MMKKILPLLTVIFALFCFNVSAKENVYVIATGGTISGAGESATGSKYSASKVDIADIIKSVPNITNLANIQAEQLFQARSQDMNNGLWLKLAKRVEEVISRRSVDAVVITHGTDTLEETAYFLNLVIKTKKPIVIVGSMRPSTSLSADGNLNLYNAVALAANKESRRKGVLVLMSDDVYNARDVRKAHTTNVAAFKADNFGAIGQVYFGKTKFYFESLKRHTYKSRFNIDNITTLPKADIIFAHANFDSNLIDYYIESGSKALILAGVGDGNINQEATEKLAEAAKQGILIVRSNRNYGGAVIRNVEIEDDEYGFVVSDNLSPQKARILASLSLLRTQNIKKIQEIFDSY